MAIPILQICVIEKSRILADRAYGSEDICTYITEYSAEYVISPKQNAKQLWHID